ncbi:AraC family transcriptional regulator [Tenacibaculum sp. IB213877]|uniref:helix-turn-helix domain-containing protein n=1 Tax=Tenacibaculum sp. IB213877 TaxID=3097351 RepID=UPI002A5A7A4C|nr:AraC family transcriptional regulator [Tenacibaculum sp. IB213877]MDY0779978.1 AraC family transcriptional regulator [Tenacibaculum sp. IB213877]
MDKKRREGKNYEYVDLATLKTTFKEFLTTHAISYTDEGVHCKESSIKSQFGKGKVTDFIFDGVELTIFDYVLNKDFRFFNKRSEDVVQLSFLFEGEKIAKVSGSKHDYLFESHECYLMNLTSYEVNVLISGNKPVKEVQIKIPQQFLLQHGFSQKFNFKNSGDAKVIVPITNHQILALRDIEQLNFKGITRKIFLEAKVLELLALQIENYNNIDVNVLKEVQPKLIKKMYKLKQYLTENLQNNYTLKDLSDKFLLNEHILKNDFKRVFGFSVNDFFNEEKMLKAKELLKNTKNPVYQIAEEIGYKNATHFSAAFKRKFEITPKEFREGVNVKE